MAEVPNILIVDDSAFLRRSVNKLLSNQGMNVFEAENLVQVKNNSFKSNKRLADIDLVLLDIHLAGDNGLDLLPYLKSEFPALPVVILSMDNNKETVLKAFNLKANDYILKPFNEQTLIDKVKYYINLDDECIISPQGCAGEKPHPKDEFDYFKVDLLTEVNRSLRSELPFSIVNLSLEAEDKEVITKEKLLNLVRDIDQVYPTRNNNYIFLLPLTDKEGREKFIVRLKDKFKSELTLKDYHFVNQITFPLDITKYVSKTRAVNYQQEILDELER